MLYQLERKRIKIMLTREGGFPMAVSFFDSKAVVPDDNMVADVLGDLLPLWDELQNHVRENYPNISGEWKHYGKASGWVFKLLSKKRNLFFFVPQNGCFRLNFVFGDKAVACIEAADLPEEIKEEIRNAKPYVEGRGIAIDVKHHEQLDAVKCLLRIKYEN